MKCRSIILAAVGAGFLVSAAAPALAERGWHGGGGHRAHHPGWGGHPGWHGPGWHGYGPRPYWYGPGVFYAPPAYYAPPPVYYGPPVLSLRIP